MHAQVEGVNGCSPSFVKRVAALDGGCGVWRRILRGG